MFHKVITSMCILTILMFATVLSELRYTPFHEASIISDHKIETVFYQTVNTTDTDVGINKRDEDGWTQFHCAVAANELTLVRSLLKEEGIDINIKTTTRAIKDGLYYRPQSTALHIAVLRGFVIIAKELLAAGAITEALDE